MAFSTPSLACWDDDDDDWYDYYYDWLDDDSSLYGDYDPNSYWLDEVEVTYEQPYDWGLDEDWWRTDDDWDDDYNDYEDNNDYDDYELYNEYSHNETNILGDKDESNPNQKYNIQKTDVTSVDKDMLEKINGFKQGTSSSCATAGIELCASLFNVSIPESTSLTEIFMKEREAGNANCIDVLNGVYNTDRISGEIIDVFNDHNMNSHEVTNIKDAIDNGEVVMAVEKITDDINHSIVIVGYNSDGYIAYDTDSTAGFYTIVTEEQLNPVYTIGIKK